MHIVICQYEYTEEMRYQLGHLKKENDHEGTAYVYENRWKKWMKLSKN